MRPQIKELLDLIEREAWLEKDEPLTYDNRFCVLFFRPIQTAFPKICALGVQIDKDIYESFDKDEAIFVQKIFDQRRTSRSIIQKSSSLVKIDIFLSTHQP